VAKGMALAIVACPTLMRPFAFTPGTGSISALGAGSVPCQRRGRSSRSVHEMAIVDKTPSDVAGELTEFARAHGLLLPNPECLKAHTARFVALGHCPCVESRPACPCEQVLSDVERMGRCECGILIDPARLCMLKSQRNGR
jgi:hypothetical protein